MPRLCGVVILVRWMPGRLARETILEFGTGAFGIRKPLHAAFSSQAARHPRSVESGVVTLQDQAEAGR
jgi:hypothetical protein